MATVCEQEGTVTAAYRLGDHVSMSIEGKNRAFTPQELVCGLQELMKQYADDTETLHAEMDNLLCDQLERLGYLDAVLLFQNTEKWYV